MTADLAASLAAVDPASLACFLTKQRWFADRDRDLGAIELHALAPLPEQGTTLACARVRLADDSFNSSNYQLPLALRAPGESAAATVITRIGELDVVDALADPVFLRRIARAFFNNETIAGPGCRWTFTAFTDLPEFGPPRPIGGEQSNTSIILGERAILKFYRRLAPGEHPDVEVARVLGARTTFRGTPPLLGVAHLTEESSTDNTVVAALYEYIPDAVDGWAHVLARLRADGDPGPELTDLGASTRALHAALASVADDPAFTPEPTDAADLERWQAATADRIRDSLARLDERRSTLPAALAPAIQRILAHQGDLATRARVPLDVTDIGPRIRHHGDYHLGQTLRTAEGWKILDFEGEPTRPLAERRAKHHPLRDVAGMLRSLAYAAAVAGIPAAEPRMRAAFLAGYDPTLADDPRRTALLALFTAEKLFYELDYELGHRPDWVWVPLAGITALLPVEPPFT